MSCASDPRGRALDALADPARAKGAIRQNGQADDSTRSLRVALEPLGAHIETRP